MNPIPVKDVTEQLLKDFFTAYWKESGTNEDEFMIEDYVRDAIRNFKYCLGERQHYNDGVRWDIMTYKYFALPDMSRGTVPIGVWPHVKVRFKVLDPMDGTPYEQQLFHFVVYGNSIASKDKHEDVTFAVNALVEKLKDRFPVMAEN